MEWVKVEDRLPDEMKEVLVYEKWRAGIPFVGWINDGKWIANPDFHECKWGAPAISNVEQKDITHWMPLPEPPTE